MKVSDAAIWQSYVQESRNFYGKGIIDFAERWANLMEAKMVSDFGVDLDAPLSETSLYAAGCITHHAGDLSNEADTEGISGFMYGAAVQTLAWSWKFGHLLLRWRNGEYIQGAKEADAVTNAGVAANPALITIKM